MLAPLTGPSETGTPAQQGAQSQAALDDGRQHTAVYWKTVIPRPARGRGIPEKALALGRQPDAIQGRGESGAVTQEGHGTWRAAERSAESGTYQRTKAPLIETQHPWDRETGPAAHSWGVDGDPRLAPRGRQA